MYKNASSSSLSSFEGQPLSMEAAPTLKSNPPQGTKPRVKQKQKCYMRNNNNYFSEFSDDQQFRYLEIGKKKVQQKDDVYVEIIQKMKMEIVRLKEDNDKLRLVNTTLLDQLREVKNRIKTQPKQQLLQPQPQQQQQLQKKQKISQLLTQISRIKQTTNKIRRQSQKEKQQIVFLKQKISEYEKINSELQYQWSWKNKFIELFIDMVIKIAEGFEESWTEKKKIQIGWKICKNVVDKALNAGIKVPRIQRTKS